MAKLKRSSGTIVKSTAAELNKMSGVTASTAELNIMDGVTSTAAELNIMDGVTSTAAELNIMDGVTSTAAELNRVDGSGVQLQRVTAKVGQSGHLELTGSSGWIRHPRYSQLEFTFTPKQTASSLILEYSYGICHGSTGGGYGWYGFRKDGNRNAWVNGSGQSTYQDSYAHFASGFSGTPGAYQGVRAAYISENNSTSTFTFGIDVKWANQNWYYAHDGSYHLLSVTEIFVG